MAKKAQLLSTVLIAAVFILFCSAPVSAASTVLKKESTGSEVSALQKDLKKLGYLDSEPTGYYGDATAEAVKEVQGEYGYDSDGIAGTTTLALIDRLLGRSSAAAETASSGDEVLKKDAEGSSVTALQKKLIKLGYLDAEATGFFGTATEKAVKNLQRDNEYDADGVAGARTLALIDKLLKKNTVVASSASKVAGNTAVAAAEEEDTETGTEVAAGTEKTGEQAAEAIAAGEAKPAAASTEASATASTEASPEKKTVNYKLPWFGNVENILSKGTTATVYDIETGLSFKIKRTYGHNHADCETLTAADTKVMKKIYGGEWSWTRRAVIVTVGDTKIAASMAGMPHAGSDKSSANKYISSRSGGYGRGQNLDAVKGNGMSGVFDLHFYGSRTHNSGRVDSKH
ncbi:MAG: peptidoglycan-binding protein, partial [Clostridiales bacterium]|nr:peptidoglycan-binding protein [Clostridiales bacterium]